MGSNDCVRGEVMKFSERQHIIFCETENCSCRRMELILNSNQCNIMKIGVLWYHLIKTEFFFCDVTELYGIISHPVCFLWCIYSGVRLSVFTWMQDKSNLRQLHKNMSAKGKCICPNLRQLRKNKSLLKIFFFCSLPPTLNTQRMLDSIYLYQSVSLSPPSRSVPSSSSHSLLTFQSSLPSFHNLSSSVSSNTLDIQHFWKPFTVTSSEMHCHAVTIHTD